MGGGEWRLCRKRMLWSPGVWEMPDVAQTKPAVFLQDFSEPLTGARVQSVPQTSDHVTLFLQVLLVRLAFCGSTWDSSTGRALRRQEAWVKALCWERLPEGQSRGCCLPRLSKGRELNGSHS